MSNDNFIARGVKSYKNIVPNPAISALLLGGAAYGATRLGWNAGTETLRSLARYPGRAVSGLTNEQWEEAMDNLKQDSGYRKWVPAVFGALAAGGTLAASYRGNKEWGGLLNWNANATSMTQNKDKKKRSGVIYPGTSGVNKEQSLIKTASDMYSYNGYISDDNFAQTISLAGARDLFNNDPYLKNEPYIKNLGSSIVNGAAIQAGTQQPTLGNIFDSATQKISNKLSFGGLLDIGVKSVISNATARLFTGALGTMTSLNPTAKRNIIDAGTWAGTVISILD